MTEKTPTDTRTYDGTERALAGAKLLCPHRACPATLICEGKCREHKELPDPMPEVVRGSRDHHVRVGTAKKLDCPKGACVSQIRCQGHCQQRLASGVAEQLKNATPGALILGKDVPIPTNPDEAKLECVPNPHPGTNYVARFTAPEFTSLCPVTGQPDFATITIDYVPDRLLVESKALKLYLFSFRNHGAFHEDCSITIAKRFFVACVPKWMRLVAVWNPRGGIPIDIFYEQGQLPERMHPPKVIVPSFRGR